MQAGGRRFKPDQLHQDIFREYGNMNREVSHVPARNGSFTIEQGKGKVLKRTSKKERQANALVSAGDERRGKLR